MSWWMVTVLLLTSYNYLQLVPAVLLKEKNPSMIKVFLSHSSKDKELVRRIGKDLESYGFDIWLDEKEILIGDSIVDKVDKGLNKSNFVLALLSKASIESGWVKQEIQSALHFHHTDKSIFVIPVLAEECEMPHYLAPLKYANLTKDYNKGIREIVLSIDEKSGINWTYEQTPKFASDSLLKSLVFNRNFSLFAIDNGLAFYHTLNYNNISSKEIKIRIPQWVDEINSKDLVDPTEDQLLKTIPSYYDESADYLKTRIGVDSTGFFNCKVGLIKIEKPIKRLGQPLILTVIPLSYWVVREFNRRMLKAPDDRLLQKLRDDNLSKLTDMEDTVTFKCPSALYVELALITADGMICIAEKNPQLSVLARTNRSKWTCTIEEGLEWNKDIKIEEKVINMETVTSRCFHLELDIFKEHIVEIKLTGVALEYTHLNSAITGLCVLSLSSGEVKTQIERSEDFQLGYKFVPIESINEQFFEKSNPNVSWHPTARLRMLAVVNWAKDKKWNRKM